MLRPVPIWNGSQASFGQKLHNRNWGFGPSLPESGLPALMRLTDTRRIGNGSAKVLVETIKIDGSDIKLCRVTVLTVPDVNNLVAAYKSEHNQEFTYANFDYVVGSTLHNGTKLTSTEAADQFGVLKYRV